MLDWRGCHCIEYKNGCVSGCCWIIEDTGLWWFMYVHTYVRNTACSGTCVESHTDSTYVCMYVGMQGKSVYSAYVRTYVCTYVQWSLSTTNL